MTSRPGRILALLCAAIAAGLLVYSQTEAFAWDEGFHLLAARLILAGRRPYADFFFGQVPLNAYWNALLMRIAGIGWRGPHVAAALESGMAVWLMADYVLRRTRLSVAISVAVLVGLNQVLVWYGAIAQAYGLSMLLNVAAFRFCVAAVEGGRRPAALSGLMAGAAASASLLSAPLGPVFFVWLSIRTRFRRSAAYAGSALLGLSPAILGMVRTPRQFIFDVVKFHVSYRQVEWSGWQAHDATVITGWLDSGPGLILVLLAMAGAWVGRRNREIALCAWATAVSSIYLATTHPTFDQYFTVEIPLAGILAATALERLYELWPGRWPAILLVSISAAGLTRELWQERDDFSWDLLTPIAAKVREVARPGDLVAADESIYLLSGILPPPGLEWASEHKVELPPEQARPLHLLPQSELDLRIRRGDYAVFETCEEDDLDRLGLRGRYRRLQQFGENCYVLWDWNRVPIRP